MRIRYTMLAITINLNRAPKSAVEEEYLAGGLRRLVAVDLATTANWKLLLPVKPAFEAVDHIDIDAIGIERGPKRHRMHVHFVVTIQHHGRVELNRRLENTWRVWVNERMARYTNGSKVHIELLNARHLNYVSKTSGGIRQILSVGAQEPVLF